MSEGVPVRVLSLQLFSSLYPGGSYFQTPLPSARLWFLTLTFDSFGCDNKGKSPKFIWLSRTADFVTTVIGGLYRRWRFHATDKNSFLLV